MSKNNTTNLQQAAAKMDVLEARTKEFIKKMNKDIVKQDFAYAQTMLKLEIEDLKLAKKFLQDNQK